jgi:hypothetical protein
VAFRLEQAGWLTVHSGLALVVIGSMVSFLTTVEGEVRIDEGRTVSAFQLSTRTRFGVAERVRGQRTPHRLLDAVADFDLNPAEKEPGRVFEADGAPLTLTVERYYASAEHVPVWHDDGPQPRAGVILDVYVRDAKKPAGTVQLDEGGEADAALPLPAMSFPVSLRRAPARLVDAMLREKAPEGHGRIRVRDRAGTLVLEIPVELAAGAESRPEGSAAPLSASARIPGTEIDVRLRAYADGAQLERGGVADLTPGSPVRPAVTLALAGPQGEDSRIAYAYVDETLPPPDEMPKGRYPYQVTYAYEPKLDVEGPALLFLAVDDRLRFVWASRDGTTTSGPVEAGAPLPLPMPALRLVPRSAFRALRVDDQYRFTGYEPRESAILLRPAWNGVAGEPFWLPLGASREFLRDDRRFEVSWRSSARPLGFSLLLYDFHRDFHPGSEQAASYESYLRLVHPAKFPDGEDVKIDMNHPLRLDGWRLFQSRFGENDSTTFLQVNRDPGLALIYPACAVVLLGLIVVLFMKKTLALARKKLERERATPMRHLRHAIAAVAAVGLGPAIFSVYVAIRPIAEQRFGWHLPLSGLPAFVFGLSLVVVFPIMVVVWFTRSYHKKLLDEAGAASRRSAS